MKYRHPHPKQADTVNDGGVIILGGGLAGLSVAYALTLANRRAIVVEGDHTVGGLAKTIVQGQFRFDLGGHRIFTKKPDIETLIRNLLGDELLVVPRKSSIYLRNKYFDYPLTPVNAVFGLGPATTARILGDYATDRLKRLFRSSACVSLEDWVVRNFGRTMFNLYFKIYSEKVWGIPSGEISAEWVAQRIQGLSLITAVKAAFLRFTGREIPTLADRFLYPSLGIGRLAESLAAKIQENNGIMTSTRVERVHHRDNGIEGVTVRRGNRTWLVPGDEFVSTIPITALVGMFHPRLPEEVLAAAAGLRYRDLVIVTVMLDRERATDLSWLYVPEPGIPFARVHEPTNWSPLMAPTGRTMLVTEHFCFAGDQTWRAHDEDLVALTVRHLESLGLIGGKDVIGGAVVRVPKAYPLFEVGYRERYSAVRQYLDRFQNLHLIGRVGSYQYLNIDHALEAGVEAAGSIMRAGKAAALRGTA